MTKKFIWGVVQIRVTFEEWEVDKEVQKFRSDCSSRIALFAQYWLFFHTFQVFHPPNWLPLAGKESELIHLLNRLHRGQQENLCGRLCSFLNLNQYILRWRRILPFTRMKPSLNIDCFLFSVTFIGKNSIIQVQTHIFTFKIVWAPKEEEWNH